MSAPSAANCAKYAEDMNNVAPNTRHSLLKKMGCTMRLEEFAKKHSGGRRRRSTRKGKKGSRKASRKNRKGSRRH